MFTYKFKKATGGVMQRLEKIAKANYGKDLRECSNNEAYYALLEMIKEMKKCPISGGEG